MPYKDTGIPEDMAQAQEAKESPQLLSCDAYFENIQSRKKLPRSLQESLTAAFARIPVSSFPEVLGGKGENFNIKAQTISLFSLENGLNEASLKH